MSRDFVGALLQLNAEKQISREQLIGAVEDGIQSAYRRVAGDEDIHVRIDAETGKIRVFRARRVVDEIEDEFTEMTVDAGAGHRARRRRSATSSRPSSSMATSSAGSAPRPPSRSSSSASARSSATRSSTSSPAARASSSPARSTGSSRARSSSTSARTSRRSSPRPSSRALEHYRIGQNVKAFVLEVRRSTKGPQIFVSRTHKGFLKRLFELEVPEIHSGTVEIKAIAREAGSRSKVAVASRQDGLDPVGATVGQRGARVQAVVAELSGEKIDVIPWSDDAGVFVANALSPAQVISVDIDEEHRIASVTVPERMLSLAIGREGQNARLAARLTGWRIDIRSDVSVAEAKAAADAPTPSRAAETPRAEARRRRRRRRGAVPSAERAEAAAAEAARRRSAAAEAGRRRGGRRRSRSASRSQGRGRDRRPQPTASRSRDAEATPTRRAAEADARGQAQARHEEGRRRRAATEEVAS